MCRAAETTEATYPADRRSARMPFRVGHRHRNTKRNIVLSRNFLLVVIVALAIAAGVTGYLYYQESQTGIDIQIDDGGISIEGN